MVETLYLAVGTRRSCIYISGYFSCQSSKQVLQQTIPVSLLASLAYYVGAPKLSAIELRTNLPLEFALGKCTYAQI